MRDVKDLLDEAVGSYRPTTDLEAVERRVRGRQRSRRVVAGIVAIALVAVPGWLAWTALAPAERPGTDSAPSTYLLSDFEVVPHIDPITGERSFTEVDVRFDIRWSTATFPGVHACTVRVRDAAGEEIGSRSFENESLVEATRGGIEALPVSGPIDGATAEGSCSPERLDTPVAYEITDVQIGLDLAVTYVVGWPDWLPEGEYPSTNACTAALWEGETLYDARRFNLSVPEGQQEVTFVRTEGGWLRLTGATITCQPFEREGVFPEPAPPAVTSPPPAVETVPYEDPLGWTAEVPKDWHVLPFDGFDGRVTYQGAAFSNVPLQPTEDGTHPDLSELFPDGAALIVSHREGGPAPDLLSDDSPFPLRWEDFQAIPGGTVVGQTQVFRANGTDFTLDVAVRADAREELVRALQAIVASIQPVAITEGERLPSGYVVVGADRVGRVGSGAVVELAASPFLLVHAPGGHYALDLPSEVPASSTFTWDEEAREVVWTQDGEVFARYDREGTPVLQPPGVDLASLAIHPVVQAWDGAYLLLHPDASYAPLPNRMWG